MSGNPPCFKMRTPGAMAFCPCGGRKFPSQPLRPLWLGITPTCMRPHVIEILVRIFNFFTKIMSYKFHLQLGYASTIHDLKLLLLRFAQDKSFSSESGGGGPQSNMNLVPYLIHMALYVLNTTRAVTREEKNLAAFLEMPKERWLENCYVSDGPLYYAAMALLIFAPAKWKRVRVTFLQRLLLMAHVRAVS